MPRLSIIVPFMGSVEQLENTLVSVLQNRPASSEVLVVLARPYADPYDLSGEVRFVGAADSAARSDLLNVGLQAARGEVIHVLECGCEVHDGWADAALGHFADPQVAAVTPLVVHADDRQRIVSCGLTYRFGHRQLCGAGERLNGAFKNRLQALGPTAQAAFYRRATIVSIGGFDAVVGQELVDIEVALALKRHGYCCRTEQASHIAARADTPPPRSFATGRRAQELYWRYAESRLGLRLWLGLLWAIAVETWNHPWRHIGTWTHLLGRLVSVLRRASNRLSPRAWATSQPRDISGSGPGPRLPHPTGKQRQAA